MSDETDKPLGPLSNVYFDCESIEPEPGDPDGHQVRLTVSGMRTEREAIEVSEWLHKVCRDSVNRGEFPGGMVNYWDNEEVADDSPAAPGDKTIN